MSYKIGIIGMVSAELKKDRWGTLKRLADLGYQGYEGASVLSEGKKEKEEYRKRLADLGLETVALRCSHWKEDELDEAIANAHLLGTKFLVDYHSGPESMDEVLALAEQLERMAAKCLAEGIQLLYHNHEHEFSGCAGGEVLKNECIFDLYYENTEKLQFELDIGWCHYGKADPVRLIRRCGHRIPILHVKDRSDDYARKHFCSVGTGTVNCFGAMEAAAAKGAQWMVVEHDNPLKRLSGFEKATASILNIREVGLHPTMR
jgi:sugar phosphate isomerase/epimerase